MQTPDGQRMPMNEEDMMFPDEVREVFTADEFADAERRAAVDVLAKRLTKELGVPATMPFRPRKR